MIWIADIDGVITANPSAMAWLTWHLKKNENQNTIYILTWRDGSNPDRKIQTKEDLDRWGIVYDDLIMADKRFKTLKEAAIWKIDKVRELKADIWLDDELKIYKRDYSFDLDKLLPNTEKVWI